MSVYLELTHGRRFIGDNPSDGLLWEKLHGWGVDGPILGPFPYIHCTYASHLQLGDAATLEIVDGLVVYDRTGFGDWSIADAKSIESRPDFAQRHMPFNPALALVEFLSQNFVVMMVEQGEDRPLYLCDNSPGESWSADIDAATAVTAESARQLAEAVAPTLMDDQTLFVGRLRYVATDDQFLRSDAPEPIEQFSSS